MTVSKLAVLKVLNTIEFASRWHILCIAYHT